MEPTQSTLTTGGTTGTQHANGPGFLASALSRGNVVQGVAADESEARTVQRSLSRFGATGVSPSESVAVRSDQEYLFRQPSARRVYEIPLQKWLGRVAQVEAATFRATLRPILGADGELEADVYLEEVDVADHALVAPGAEFSWTIGYRVEHSGRSRFSAIRFRRLPPWTQSELNAARDAASRRREVLKGLLVDGP